MSRLLSETVVLLLRWHITLYEKDSDDYGNKGEGYAPSKEEECKDENDGDQMMTNIIMMTCLRKNN
jgi:hypothetical protein